MGRPRVHDASTAAQLLEQAERIAGVDGLPALSVRRLASETDVSTRAIYSLFGSKDALVAALGASAFERLAASVAATPVTDDPVLDLVEAGAQAFRGLVVEHPVLFQIGIQNRWPLKIREPVIVAAHAAWQHLLARTSRLAGAGLLGTRDAEQAAAEFHAMCEGLAVMESRGLLAPMSGSADPARVWRSSLGALVAGFAIT